MTKTNSNTVYQVKLYCGGGTVDAGMTYANNTEAVTKEHNMPETASFNSEKKIYEKLCQTKGCGKTVYYANAAGTIEALHAANLPCKVMVGGAVLTKAYAEQIGADFYAKDAKASADYAKQIFG